MLSWVEGEVRPPGSTFDEELPEVLRLVRRVHDLCPGVCHNDLAPRNTVWAAGGPVFIDWDLCAPGRPIEDVAHACWQFLALGPQRQAEVQRVATALRRGVDAYGLDAAGRAIVVNEIVAWQERCADGIDDRARRGEPPFLKLVAAGAVADIRASREWVLDQRAAFEEAVATSTNSL
jgi:Ser/Thr protein kinase RdoA (MazF antagonist)